MTFIHPYQKEFSELSAAAERQLQGREVQVPHHNLLLRLWHYHSFDSCNSLLVYVPVPRYQQSESPLAIAVTWNRPFDATRFTDPMKGLAHGLSTTPTITLKQASLPASLLDLKLHRLEEIALPITMDGYMSVDGEEFGFETFSGGSRVQLRWRSSAVEAWLPLREWFEEMVTFIERNLE